MPFSADICVIGAGPVGLAFALALQKRSAGRRAVILDRGQARPDDGKSVAFGPHSRAFLRELDAWPSHEKPIRRAEISFSVFPDLTRDGGRGGFRPLELRADGESALAYVASHEEVRAALFSQLRETREQEWFWEFGTRGILRKCGFRSRTAKLNWCGRNLRF